MEPRPNAFWRAAPWLMRALLVTVTLLFATISLRYLANPVAAAAADEITVGSVMAISRLRIGFGAFPLAFAAVLVACLVSERRILHGLVAVAIVLGTATIVRGAGILIDGSAEHAVRLLRIEAIVWMISLAAIPVELARRRRREAARAAHRVPAERPRRYHPMLVALHWLLAVFIVAALCLGMFVLKTIPNASPDKIHGLRAHVLGGFAILALTVTRLAVRLSTARPQRATTGNRTLDGVARLSHAGLYALPFVLVASGFATAVLAGLFPIVLGHSGAPLPQTFAVFPTRVLHGYVAKALVALIGLHVAAALYHQLVRKDRLLERMTFGARLARRRRRQLPGAGVHRIAASDD